MFLAWLHALSVRLLTGRGRNMALMARFFDFDFNELDSPFVFASAVLFFVTVKPISRILEILQEAEAAREL